MWSCGTIFRIAPYTGAPELLAEFNFSNGCNPKAGVAQASDDRFYGTTEKGGYGTVFRFDVATRSIATLHTIDAYGATGARRVGPLFQAADGYVYGTAPQGGATGDGVVFRVDPAIGNFQVVHEFRGTDGQGATGGLAQAANGLLYGTTPVGGAFSRGVIYTLDASGVPAPQPPVANAALSTVLLEPSTVQGGTSATGTVVLTKAAPAGGATVALSKSSNAVSIPASVTVPEGSNQVRFAIATKRVKATACVIITGSHKGVSKTGTLTLTK